MLADSHCHLNYPGLIEDLPGVFARARAAGVSRFLAIAAKAADWAPVLAIARAYPDVRVTVGVHPHEAAKDGHVTEADLLAQCGDPLVAGVGETGLDYYYDHGPRDEQQRMFHLHLEAARAADLPVIVHTRDAEEDTAAILREHRGVQGVIHCFTASAGFAQIALDLGFYISFSGILTFKSAKDLQETAKTIPLDRVLVETDSPYLAPIPHRGRPCEPAFTADTARFLAQLRGISLDELADITTNNYKRLFKRAA